MHSNTMVTLGVIVIALGIAALILFMKRRRTVGLRSRFGPEYNRTVEETHGQQEAEAQLISRQKRVAAFAIHPLKVADRGRYAESWRMIQVEFVDNPKRAVTHADELLNDVMSARGYPVSDFDQRSADLSVHHPVVVQNYRAANEITLRHERGDAGTEDLRQAMIHYRALFDDLIGEVATPVRAHAL